MRAYLGVTDFKWYRHLAQEPQPVEEVNFWFPSSSQGFAALRIGEYLVLKTHVLPGGGPLSHRIVGVGTYSGFAKMRMSEAWELFASGNGVADFDELRTRIGRYRRTPIGETEDPRIGCVLLSEPLFFPEDQTLPAPDDFKLNTVRGKTYDLEELDSQHPVYVAVAHYILRDVTIDEVETAGLIYRRTHGEPRLVVPRVGQKAFKAVVKEVYHRRCAVTGDKVEPVLIAAHILPVSKGGEHRIDNGLLLRSDVHTLFDEGYIGIDRKYRLRVSPTLREEFDNGDYFYSREGNEIAIPSRKVERPNAEFLEWHNDEVFRTSTSSAR